MLEKKKKKCSEGAADWLLTYGDMTTLLLTFFIMMFTTAEIDGHELRMILAAFQGLGIMQGGNTLQAGKLAELGNTFMTLPSMERGKALDKAKQLATSIFQPEIMTDTVRVKEDERGLVISLSAEAFFRPASDEVDIDKSRDLLQRIAGLLSSPDLSDRTFRLEGHTDSVPPDPNDEKNPTNWELSVHRAVNVLKYLVQFGANEDQFQVAGYADNSPYLNTDEYIYNLTEEARAKNRRVDIVILTEGHL